MKNDLLKAVEAFQRDAGLSDHRVGWLLAKNGRLIQRLRGGGRIWPETVDAITAAIKEERAKRNLEDAT